LYGIGLKFPNLIENPALVNRNFDIVTYFSQSKAARQDNDPLVIFPEVIINRISQYNYL
jgi:hypothetical protein